MREIDLMVAPGAGLRKASITNEMTVEQFVVQEGLHGRSIIVNGVGVEPKNFATYSLGDAQEVWATGSVKGASVT
jgi:hypothetical protein